MRSANGHGKTKAGNGAGAAAKGAVGFPGLPPSPAKLLTRPALSTASLTSRLGHPPGAGDGPVNHPSHGMDVHIIFTSNGSPASNWQARVLAATVAEAREMAYGDRLAGFTRILHRSSDDALVGEIPTFRATPLTPACDAWCEHPAGDRPDAVRQFFDAARVESDLISAPWVYLIEPDYLFVKPLIMPLAETTGPSYGFPLAFLDPQTRPEAAPALTRLLSAGGGDSPLTSMPHAGPAPALLRAHEWVGLAPVWAAMAAVIEADAEAKAALGPAREAWAFALAAALAKLKLDLTPPPRNLLIAQPPLDEDIGEAAAFHYTWGVSVRDAATGAVVWAWDKRGEKVADGAAPPLIPLPAASWREGLVLGDGAAATAKNVSRALFDTLRSQATTLNRASRRAASV